MFPSEECINDRGSCGNACCSVEYVVSASPEEASQQLTEYLSSGGLDGLFKLKGSQSLAQYSFPWDAIIQGTHTTYKLRYVDTLNFNIRPLGGNGSAIKAFAISSVAGALNDHGQNFRTLSIIGRGINVTKQKVLFGCGGGPSTGASDLSAKLSADLISRTEGSLIAATFITVAGILTWVVFGHFRKKAPDANAMAAESSFKAHSYAPLLDA